MNIELTEQQINIIYQLILNANWSGKQVEFAVELKKKIEEEMKKASDIQLKGKSEEKRAAASAPSSFKN